MKARDGMVLERCVEIGIKLGLHRARKHQEAPPTEAEVVQAIQRAVMEEVEEWFIFEEDRA
jgi:hypothetical protein